MTDAVPVASRQFEVDGEWEVRCQVDKCRLFIRPTGSGVPADAWRGAAQELPIPQLGRPGAATLETPVPAGLRIAPCEFRQRGLSLGVPVKQARPLRKQALNQPRTRAQHRSRWCGGLSARVRRGGGVNGRGVAGSRGPAQVRAGVVKRLCAGPAGQGWSRQVALVPCGAGIEPSRPAQSGAFPARWRAAGAGAQPAGRRSRRSRSQGGRRRQAPDEPTVPVVVISWK